MIGLYCHFDIDGQTVRGLIVEDGEKRCNEQAWVVKLDTPILCGGEFNGCYLTHAAPPKDAVTLER